MTHADILRLWPSVGALASDMGKPHSTVSNWIQRNRIPPEYWVRLVESAADREIPITYGMLAKGVAREAA